LKLTTTPIMKYIILTLLIFNLPFLVSAQSVVDALRFSQTETASTARMAGIGGGMSALGGEFSVINVNPAGLAIYRGSEFSITPSFDIRRTTGILAGPDNSSMDDRANSFSFSNIGLVFNSKPNGKWRTANFAIGFNRILDFREDFSFRGQSSGSITDQFLELSLDANGLAIPAGQLDDFFAGPALDAGALLEDFDVNGNLIYVTDFDLAEPGALVERLQTIRRDGSISELSLSYAGNYNNKLLIGGSLGIPILNFSQAREYEEFDPGTQPDGNIPFFESLQYTDTLNTDGVGINLKLGMIYWPTPKLRVGAAVHTPTFYSLTDFFDTSVEYTFTEDGITESGRGLPFNIREIDFGFRTPWRFIGSGGLIIPKFGLLTAEVEYVNYAGNNYNFDKNGNDLIDIERGEEINDDIDAEVESALNYRLGVEFKIERFLLRAGYNYLGTARTEFNESRSRISVGGGYRADRYYFDLAYVRGSTESQDSPYDLEDNSAEQLIDRDLISNRILFTFGYRF